MLTLIDRFLTSLNQGNMANCTNSILITNTSPERYTPEKIYVPCGKCPNCIANRANEWGVRLSHQAKASSSVYFITLTYALPPLSKHLLPTLKKSDFQNFMKRLRKLEQQDGNKDKLVYYAAAEYGELNERPHYHMILFNLKNERNVIKAWSKEGKPFGMVDVQPPRSVASYKYTAGYIGKKIGIPKFKGDDRQKEFSLMSKRIGQDYLKIYGHLYRNKMTAWTYLQGKKVPLPRYYKNKIFNHQQKQQLYEQSQIRQKEKDTTILKSHDLERTIRTIRENSKVAPKSTGASRTSPTRRL